MQVSKIFVLPALLLVTMQGVAYGQPKAVDPFEQNQKLGRGVNIIGYDPLWRNRDQARFQAKYFRLLKEAGFNSVRINLHPFRHMDTTNGWTIRQNWLDTMDWAMREAQQQGLIVVLDMHEFGAMGENPEGNKEKFLAFWKQLAAHCQNAPSTTLFEVLNEPNKKLTPALWNDYLKSALEIIRKSNPTRTVICGPAFWNGIGHLHELEIPETDRNIIVTVHYYSPMPFTHQGAAWTDHKDKLGVEWLGTEDDKKALNKDFDLAAKWAKEHNRPIYLGEFGAYDKAAMESRARYTSAVARAAEVRGWSWAYWQFDNDFILYNVGKDSWVEPIRDALVPR